MESATPDSLGMAFLPIILDVLPNLPYSIRIDATFPNVMSKGLTIP
jgi:hypothetical protein